MKFVRFRVVLLISLFIGLLPRGVAAAEPISGSLVMTSDPGDQIGEGRRYSYSTPTDEFSITSYNAGLHVRIFAANGDHWGLTFEAPDDQVLSPATYVRAGRSSFVPPKIPGMEVDGNGRGCNTLGGSFKVRSITRGPGNAVTGLHLTFEQFCNLGATALRGDLRLGTTGPDVPEPATQIPTFPDTTAVPAFLNITGDPADYIGGFGEEYSYEASDLDEFKWVVGDNKVVVQVFSAEGDTWSLRFSDPTNRRLEPGTFTQTWDGYRESQRGLMVTGKGRACDPESATFKVTRADYREDGSLENFQASFYQRCKGSAGALRGQVSAGVPLVETLKLNDPASGWGYNGQGELGNATNLDRPAAAAVAGSGFHKVAAGGLHSLGLKEDGSVWAWGWNGVGQLGDGTLVDRATPVKVAGLENVASVSAGFYSSLAVKKDGTVWTWGWNGLGQAGDGTRIDRRTPVKVRGLDNVVEASAGMAHNLALKLDGTAWAWGWNGYGQIGDGTTTDRLTPVKVRDLYFIRHVSAGGFHSLAVDGSLKVRSWGSNVVGQLGDGTNIDRHAPVTVQYAHDVVHISAGLLHSVANSHTWYRAYAWGWNGVGQLGDGTTVDRNTAVFVSGMDETGEVSAGCYHSLGIKKNGAVASWGWNAYGQLGNGTHTDSRVATEIAAPASGHKTVRVAAGCLHSLEVHRSPAGP